MARGWITDTEWYPVPSFTDVAESDMTRFWGEPIEVPDEILQTINHLRAQLAKEWEKLEALRASEH